MHIRITLYSLAVALTLLAAGADSHAFAQAPSPEFARTAATQGEYIGWVSGGFRRKRMGLQIVADGLESYQATVLPGGLPSAGAHVDSAVRVDTQTRGGLVTFNTANYRFWVTGSEARVIRPDGVLCGVLRKVQRSSPTMGATPPPRAVIVFDGTDTGELTDPAITPDGLLKEGPMTRRDVGDFSIHAEFRIPFMPEANSQARGNSGLYLQRRYEVQILDSFGLEGTTNGCGSLYRQRRPDVNACLPPGSWQTYDIKFRAARYNEAGEKTENARITVRQNGIVIHDDVELRNKTGAGQPEGPQPMPIWFQDHGDPVRFRNIWLVPHTE